MSPEVITGTLTTKDRQEIHYDHYRNNHGRAVVLAHGYFNSKQSVLIKELARYLNDYYDVISLDFRGHGKSPGLFSWTSKEYQDLEAVLAFAHDQYLKIGVVGFSLGAATSLIAASKTNLIDSLISVSAPSEFNRIDYHFWELDVENDILYGWLGEGKKGKGSRPGPFWLKKEKPIDSVQQIKIPVFYIHGDADWLIKPWHSQKLFELTLAPKRLTILKNGPHAEYLIRKNKEELFKEILQWFFATLPPSN